MLVSILGLLGVALSTVIQVDAGELGVQTLFGQVQKRVLPSGLNVVNPLVDVTRFDTKTQNYTMSAVQTEGQQAPTTRKSSKTTLATNCRSTNPSRPTRKLPFRPTLKSSSRAGAKAHKF